MYLVLLESFYLKLVDLKMLLLLYSVKKAKTCFKQSDQITLGVHLLFSTGIGETFIRSGDKLCKNIVGYDANALHLWALGDDMPVGGFIRRNETDNFKPIKFDRFQSMFDWMDWIIHRDNVDIQHKQNHVKEIRAGVYYLDGYDSMTKTAYEFHGCYFHGHDYVTMQNKRQKEGEDWWEKQQTKLKDTTQRTEDLRRMGYSVTEIWECDFNKLKRQDKNLSDFITNRRPDFYKRHGWTVTDKQILDAGKKMSFLNG